MKTLFLITTKPILYTANVDEEELNKDNEYTKSVKEYSLKMNSKYLKLSGSIEMEISKLPLEEQSDFLNMYSLQSSGLNQLIQLSYSLLGLQTYFTAGEKEIKAWTIKKGFSAPEAAGVIHSDFQRGFIKAEIYNIEDLEKYHSEHELKNAGKIRQEGKEYTVQDGDIILFRFNV